MIEKILDKPEIYRIEVALKGNALRVLNSYVILSQGDALVVDTGFRREDCEHDLKEGLAELGLIPDDCSLFLTHLHSDHIGLSGLFGKKGKPVYMGRADYEYLTYIKTGGYEQEIDQIYEQEGFPGEDLQEQKKDNPARIYGVNKMFEATLVENGDEIHVGDVTLRCLEMGGHTPGHMCLYEPESSTVFLGDHVLYDITPNVMEWPRINNSLGRYLNSLERLKNLPVELALPAHRGGSEKQLKKRIEELIIHHRNRLAEIRNILRLHGELNCYEIASKMKWSLHGKTWETAPKQQRWFAMGEARAHLVYLVIRGDVCRKEYDQTITYTLE